MLIIMLLADIPFAVPLAVFTGFTAAFIPIVGTYLAGIVPVVVALAAAGPGRALILLAWIVIYQQLENYLLEPRLSKKTMNLNLGIALAAALAGGSVGGIIGAFFALPTAAAIQSFITTYATRYEVEDTELTRVEEPAEPPTDPPQAVEETGPITSRRRSSPRIRTHEHPENGSKGRATSPCASKRPGVGRERERPTSREPACLHTQHASIADRWMVVPLDARPIDATGGAHLPGVSIAQVAGPRPSRRWSGDAYGCLRVQHEAAVSRGEGRSTARWPWTRSP
jgi:hypothetical protein